MELLQDTGIWVLLSFLLFAFVLWKFARGAFLGMLDRRIESIRAEISEAETLRVEAQELLAQYQRRQRDAAKEAEEIVANARAHAAEIQKDADKELKAIAKRREQQLAERLKRMEEQTAQEIRAYAAELAVKATSEIIAKQMDKKTNENLVNASIKDIPKQLVTAKG